jgi:hypothetical protein
VACAAIGLYSVPMMNSPESTSTTSGSPTPTRAPGGWRDFRTVRRYVSGRITQRPRRQNVVACQAAAWWPQLADWSWRHRDIRPRSAFNHVQTVGEMANRYGLCKCFVDPLWKGSSQDLNSGCRIAGPPPYSFESDADG